MATPTPAALWGPSTVGIVPAAIYAVPAATTGVISRAVFTNVSAGAVTLTVWIVRAGGSATSTSIVIGAATVGFSLASGQAYVAVELAGLVLLPGDQIFAQASAAGAINAVGSGWTQ